MKNIVIVGAGGLGREVMFQLERINKITKEYNILGFIDDNLSLKNTKINGYNYLGDTNFLLKYPRPIFVVVCVGNPYIRKKIATTLMANKNIIFPTIFADKVVVSNTVKFGIGCIFSYNSTATVNIEIGDFALISINCLIGHDCKIGNFVTLYPSSTISGNVTIGDGCEIGVNSCIIQGKTIGENSVIGGGATVISDIPSNCVAVGVPAKVKKTINFQV